MVFFYEEIQFRCYQLCGFAITPNFYFVGESSLALHRGISIIAQVFSLLYGSDISVTCNYYLIGATMYGICRGTRSNVRPALGVQCQPDASNCQMCVLEKQYNSTFRRLIYRNIMSDSPVSCFGLQRTVLKYIYYFGKQYLQSANVTFVLYIPN